MMEQAERRRDDRTSIERAIAYQTEIKPYIPQLDKVIDLTVSRVRDESVCFTSPQQRPSDIFSAGDWIVECNVTASRFTTEAEARITETLTDRWESITRFIYMKRVSGDRGELQYGLVIRQMHLNPANLRYFVDRNPYGELRAEEWLKDTTPAGERDFPNGDNPKGILAELKAHIEGWTPTGDKKGIGFWLSSTPQGMVHGNY